MSDPRRRYFVATGPDTDAMLVKLREMYDAHAERTRQYLAHYGGKFVWQADGYPNGFLLPEGSPVPKGFKQTRTVTHKGEKYAVMEPAGASAAAREARTMAQKVGALGSSEFICAHYGARNRMILVGGTSSWHATGWANIEKALATLQVPEKYDDRFTPTHPELREITFEQYKAITEDGAGAPEVEQPSWRVDEFWSSANPGEKVLMLATTPEELERWPKRSDFIRTVGSSLTHRTEAFNG